MTLSIAMEIAALRPDMLSFARQRSRNAVWVEDVVSEAMLAALEQAPTFSGRSQLKTWVIAILKHKMMDRWRKLDRESVSIEDVDEPLADLEWLDFQIPVSGPERAAMDLQFITIFQKCLEQLSQVQQQAFLMRECLDLDAPQVCSQLGLSESNLWVLLHRARVRMRCELELHGIGPKAKRPDIASPGAPALVQ